VRVSSSDVQNSFGKYLKIATCQEPVIITKNGQDIARLVPYPEPLLLAEGQKMSYQAYLGLVANSEERYELIDGELYLLDSPVFDHQTVLGELFGSFYNWFKGKPCRPVFAPLDVTLYKSAENVNVVQPDLVVICDTDQIDAKGKYIGVPTLVIEVLSPSTRRKDILQKTDLYLQTGIKEYWLIDLDKQAVYRYVFADGDIEDYQAIIDSGTVQSTCFAGLEIRLDDLFGRQNKINRG